MLILIETPAGYTLWRVNNEAALSQPDLCTKYPTPDDALKVISLQQFTPFGSAQEATEAAAAIGHSELHETLIQFIQENIVSQGIKEQITIADDKLAHAISSQFKLDCVAPATNDVPEIFRLIRNNLDELIPEITPEAARTMELGVSHNIATQTLKFSPSKVDSMIVHSVNLLEELDKEINNYGMRVREWYGWHFPELRLITSDNLIYAQIVLKMGYKENAEQADLSDVVTDEQYDNLVKYSKRSIGTELSPEDLDCIQQLATQVVQLITFRNQISEYINQRMRAIAPNLSELVGEGVGARLIAHAGSLRQLSKAAGSTIQVFGAEKALFRALKEKKKTPKYGLIYHAQLVSHADQKFKGNISRKLAAKVALSSRIDEFGTEGGDSFGVSDRERLETHLRELEGQKVTYSVSRSVVKEEPKKIVVEATPDYQVEKDFQIDPSAEKPRKKKHHKVVEAVVEEAAPAVEEAAPQPAEEATHKKRRRHHHSTEAAE